jgi:hypothetical protein
MAQTDLALQENDTEQPIEFSAPERKTFTQPYDLSLQTLLEQWDSGSLELPEMESEYSGAVAALTV